MSETKPISSERVILSDKMISKVIRDAKAGKLDGKPVRTKLADHEVKGLWLRVSAGNQSWLLQCRDQSGRVREFQLGSFPGLTIAKARLLAGSMREKIRNGFDPVKEKVEKREKIEREAKSHTLRSLIELYSGTPDRDGNPQSQTKSWAWRKRRVELVFRDLLDKPLMKLSLQDFQACVDGFHKPIGASKSVRCILPMLKWASKPGRGIVSTEFCQIESPVKNRTRDRVLDHNELAKILPVLRNMRGNSYADCMNFILLTVLRLNEAACLKFSDISDGVATIRDTKNGKPHLVPLSKQALDLIVFRRSLCSEGDGYVFPSRGNAVLDGWHRMQLKVHAITDTNGWHRHDLRRTGATMMGKLGIPPHVIEASLNHAVIHSPIASVYNRSDYRPEVAEALQRLADKLDAIAGDNVVSFPERVTA